MVHPHLDSADGCVRTASISSKERIGELDMNFLALDVEPFLFAPEQQERIITFRDDWLNKHKMIQNEEKM